MQICAHHECSLRINESLVGRRGWALGLQRRVSHSPTLELLQRKCDQTYYGDVRGAVEGKYQCVFEGQGRRRGELNFEGLAGVTSWGRHLRQKEHMGEGAGGCVHKSTALGKRSMLRAVAVGAGFTVKGPDVLSLGAWGRSYR